MKRIAVWSVLAVSVIVVPFAFAQQSNVSANAGAVPRLIRFSGVAKDSNGQPLTGVIGVTYALYKEQEGGAALWIETQNVQADASGHYTVLLGATEAEGLPVELFSSGEARWLGVEVSGQAEQSRVLLLSVPYALKAADAETVGGLPPSAFVLVAPASNNSTGEATVSAANAAAAPPLASSNVTTTGGTVNAVPLWTTATSIQSSAITQNGIGATATIGINTTTPASTLDVAGGGTIRGLLNLPATGTATASSGKNSQPLNLSASAFNSTTGTATTQNFRWQAEPAGNNTSPPSGTLNLLFASGTAAPAETGLRIASNGRISATGFDLGGTPFAFGSALIGNVFLGFSGNATTTGTNNIGIGPQALGRNTGGGANTAVGAQALTANGTGSYNTAIGENSLNDNSGGSFNTAIGLNALYRNSTGINNTGIGAGAGNTLNNADTTGNNNTFVGANTAPGTHITLSNATAIGANAEVNASNSLVLGSISGTNGASASVNVGIGTTTPTRTLHLVDTNGDSALFGDPGCGRGYVGLSLNAALSGCTNFTMVGDSAGNTFMNTNGNGGFYILNKNQHPPLVIVDSAGNMSVKGNLSAGGGLSSTAIRR